ncbi:DOF zinc finger protein DOF5.6, partial [Tanacetum coccineum]
RYWTKGGTLRKIPIGGGIRKKSSAVVKRTADVSPPTVENIPVKTEGGETSGLNIGLSIFTSSTSKVD